MFKSQLPNILKRIKINYSPFYVFFFYAMRLIYMYFCYLIIIIIILIINEFGVYSWASDSCCTNLKRRGERIVELPLATNGFSAPSNAKCFLIRRETKICGRCCHSFITSFGVFT